MPSSCAVSSTESPSQCRSTTTLRCMIGQRLQRVEERRALLDGERVRATGSCPSQPGPLAPPGAAVLVDVGAHDDLPGVGLLAAVAVQPRPGDVQLDQGGLQQVVGAVPVAADRVGDPAQVGLAGRDELANASSRDARFIAGLRPRRTARGRTVRSSSKVAPTTSRAAW